MPGTLYKLFNAEGECIYVGQSMNGAQRTGSHKSQDWWTEVASASFTHFETRDAAVTAESEILAASKPRYNVRQPGRPISEAELKARRARREESDRRFQEQFESTYRPDDATCSNCGLRLHYIAKGTAISDHECSRCGLKAVELPLDKTGTAA